MDTKALKDKILQLAIQGKLVAQDLNDEPASVLLEKIKEEKEKLIKEKKIRKQKPLPDITEEEKPFDIPKGWEWCRLGEMCNLINGKKMVNLDVSYLEVRYLRGKKEAVIKNNGKAGRKGDLIILVDGENSGEVFEVPHDGYIGSTFKKLNIYSVLDFKFIQLIIKKNKRLYRENKTGSAIPHLDKKMFANTVAGLPPLLEQKRIVKRVGELFILIDDLEGDKEELLKVIRLTRDKVLQLAIHGKLVEQVPNDEPASVLLEKIKEGKEKLVKEKKIRKQKPLPDITEEEKPFHIPKGWEWVIFSQITICRDGERIPVSSKERENRDEIYDYYGASGVIDKIDTFIFDKPLLLIGEDGANLISRSTPIAFIAEGQYWVNNHAHVIDSIDISILRYLEIYINRIDLKPYVTGTAQPKLNQGNLNNIVISLPPLSEQKRIVEKVDKIMNLFDELEKQMKGEF